MKIGRRFWLVLPLVLGCLGLGLLLARRPEPGLPVGLMDRPYRMPEQRRSWFSRLVPATPAWAWLWRLKDAVLGRRPIVNIEGSAFAAENWSDAALTDLMLSAPDFTGKDGHRLWVRSGPELRRLRTQLLQNRDNELLSSPRMTTAAGAEACLFSGSMIVANGCTNQVGLSFDLYPRLEREMIDLTAIISVSETVTNSATNESGSSPTPVLSVRTNLDVGAHLRLTNGAGMFLLGGGPGTPDRRHVLVILSAASPKR